MSDISLLVVAFILVLISGVLVATEAAIIRVSRANVEQLKKDGHRKAEALGNILDDRAKYVNSLLFGHLSMSTIAIVLVANATTLIIAAVSMVVVGYVLLGVAPQTIGRQNPETIAFRTLGLTKLLSFIFGPFSRLFILIGNAITPGKGFREGPFSTQAELRELVDLAGAESVIEDEERQMIHSVFELGDTIAREVMVPRTEMVWVESSKTLRQAMSLGLRSGYSRIPVVGESIDDIVGLIYVKDIAKRIFEHSDSQTTQRVSDIMRPAYLVPDTRSADELLRDMQAARTHLAVLVDEYGGTAGLVTIEDILEEIVGEISDEHDLAAPDIEELGDEQYRVSSRLHVDDLAELLQIDIGTEGVETVVGLMAKQLGIVPIPGAQVNIGNYILTAESAVGRRKRISTVLVMRDTFSQNFSKVQNDDLD